MAVPFSRSQWASQSVRVTAKEMSIVSTRGKSTTIAERFSKYQMAADDGNMEKKKKMMVAEPPPSTVHSGNLSLLKKRWEELQPSSCRTRSVSSSCGPAQPLTHITTSTRPEPEVTSAAQNQPLNTASDTQVRPEESSGPAQSSWPHNHLDMEATPPRGSVGGAEVPDTEKPSVPLNSLKMMFETGENLANKVGLAQLPEQVPSYFSVKCADLHWRCDNCCLNTAAIEDGRQRWITFQASRSTQTLQCVIHDEVMFLTPLAENRAAAIQGF
ncbi:LIM domain and actin-binding protein 1 [Takifugu flavidus]|uniref:LIM domain and actin-binding protein 1 n=1 Tax=Takifugu flavidus TaxID=433684 RepID=A0A5C6MN09_9TELE|nr:LIM domain and actin-binding protein 1 [Takifugu flavidus]